MNATASVGRLLPALAANLRPAAGTELAAFGLDLRGLRIADVGAGDGRLALGAAEDAATVIAIDPDPEALARGRNIARRDGVGNVSFREGAAQELFSWTL